MTGTQPSPALLRGSSTTRRRVSRVLLAVGAAVIALHLFERAPRDQVLVFRIAPDQRVQQLSATWTPHGDVEPAGGVTLHFGDTSPARVRHALRAPNGDYLLTVRLNPRDVAKQTTVVRRVTLQGGTTVVPLESQ